MTAGFLLLLALAVPESHSVLLVTIDTLRGDFVGSHRVATPHLDHLAARGVFFTRARSPAPLTLPSHASLMTGLYPPEHGVRDNGAFRLGDGHVTLAEVLRDRGYETAAFVGSFVLDRRFGLDRGFELYDDETESKVEELESFEAERSGEQVRLAFEKWLSKRDGRRPFFAWVHLYDPHAPYEPPEPYRTRYAQDPYAGEVAFADAVFGELLVALERRGLLAETLVAVAGDHGEGLGEHDEATHSVLIYNSTLHVPMLLAGPGVPRGRRVAALTRTIDLGATLLDYVGAGTTLGTGRSLKILVEGGRDERTSYSESLYAFRHLGWSPLFSLETEHYHFIDAPSKELYVLSGDPNETVNALEEHRSSSRDLFRRLKALQADFEKAEDASREMDLETRAKLETLGYVTSGAAPSRVAGELPDPKREMDTYRKLQTAQFQRSRGECRAAIATLSGVEERNPLVYEIVGACHMALENWDAAEKVFRRAIAEGLERPLFHLDLGVLAFRQGHLDDAKKELGVALALDARNVSAYYQLGNVLRALGRLPEAVETYTRALDINRRYVFAWNGLGMTLARMGRDKEALTAFRRAADGTPSVPLARFNLAVQLERMDRRKEALESYRRFLGETEETTLPREHGRAREAVRRLEANPG